MVGVICLGGLVLDQVFDVPELPALPVKVIADGYLTRAGGIAATAAVAIAALGTRSAFWGRIGSDIEGRAVLGHFEGTGVDVGNVISVEGARTPVSAVLVNAAGERMIAVFGGADLNGADTELRLAGVPEFDAVLCDTRWPAGARMLLREARRLRIPSVLDADLSSADGLEEFLELADHIIFSEVGLSRFTGLADIEKGLRAVFEKTKAQIGVTLGSKGCGIWQDGCMEVIPGYQVPVRDTTGAGDTFHGAYALAIAERKSVRQAVEFANAAAALKCALGRGWRGMPDRRAVENLMMGTF